MKEIKGSSNVNQWSLIPLVFIELRNGGLSLFFLIIVLACFFTVMSVDSYADPIKDGNEYTKIESSKKIDIDWSKLRTAASVDFIIYPYSDVSPSTFDYLPQHKSTVWSEEAMKKIGCNFSTNQPSQIRTLVEILRRSNIQSRENRQYINMSGMRMGIYLTLPDQTEARFLFPLEMSGGAEGLFSQTLKFDNQRIFYDNKSTPWYFLLWASYQGKPKSSVEGMASLCEATIRYQVYREEN